VRVPVPPPLWSSGSMKFGSRFRQEVMAIMPSTETVPRSQGVRRACIRTSL
jgi:hypothetical protein